MIKRWVAIGKDNEVLAYGMGIGRFNRRYCSFTNQMFERWVKDGMRYAQIFTPFPKRLPHINIEQLKHGKIRSLARLD